MSKAFTSPHIAMIKNKASQFYKFKFYDLILQTDHRPAHSAESSQLLDGDLASGRRHIFEGNYNTDTRTAQQKIETVFGGRIKGDDRKSSSRLLRGEDKLIAGVRVPAKPMEPDNCCMSGCINCVWELFNDDVKDWKLKLKLAAESLKVKGGRWPENFDAPVDILGKDNLPLSLLDKSPEEVKVKSGWEAVPVLIRVFAEMEKKIKARQHQNLA